MDDSNLSASLTNDSESTGGGGLSSAVAPPATPEPTSNAPADNTLTPPGAPPADNLAGVQPMIQAAGQATAQDMPRLSRLKASLAGFLLSGVPGAVAGAIDPGLIQSKVAARKQMQQAQVTFASAHAAHEVAMAHQSDLEYQALPEKLQQESESRGQETLTRARQNGYMPVATIPLDQGSAQNSQNAMTALNQVKSQFGAVPSGLLYVHTGTGMTVMKMQDPTAALDTVNQARRAQGMSPIEASVFQSLKPEDRDNMARDAINFSNPLDQNGMVTQNSLNQANMRLQTLKSQPDFNGKDAMMTQLQDSVDHQKAVLDSGAGQAAIRAGQAAGAEAQAGQPGKTAAEVADINAKAGPEAQAAATKIRATAGPEAAAAGAKAEAVAKGTGKGQMEAMGGAKDATGAWNPASLPVMLVEGDADPSQVKNARNGMSAQQQEQLASQYSMEKYGKPFNMAKAQSDYKFANNTQTQNTLKYLNSLTGADNKSGNLAALVDQSNKITRTKFPAINDAEAWARLETGDPGIASYKAAVTEVADQVAKILQGGGSGTSDTKMKQAQELFRSGFTKEQINGVAGTLRTLLSNRKTELIGDNRYLQKQYGGQGTKGSGGSAAASDPFAQFGGKLR